MMIYKDEDEEEKMYKDESWLMTQYYDKCARKNILHKKFCARQKILEFHTNSSVVFSQTYIIVTTTTTN